MTPVYAVALILTLAFSALAAGQTTQPSTAPAAPRMKLWPTTRDIGTGHDTDTDPLEPTIDIYLPAHGNGAAVVVLPGGGYTHLSTVHEGSDVAHMLNAHHIAAFVVRYRHAPRYAYPIPIEDGRRAMRFVRANSASYNIDPHRIGVLGFSAGGHLAASLATGFDAGNADSSDPIERVSSRPDFAVLLYPVITFTDDAFVHKGSRQALAGTRKELWPLLSPDQHVTHQTPPVILFHAGTDKTVPEENSVLFYMACRKAGVPAEMHLFEFGPHGFGLAPTDPALRVWPELMVTWMGKNKWLGSDSPSFNASSAPSPSSPSTRPTPAPRG